MQLNQSFRLDQKEETAGSVLAIASDGSSSSRRRATQGAACATLSPADASTIVMNALMGNPFPLPDCFVPSSDAPTSGAGTAVIVANSVTLVTVNGQYYTNGGSQPVRDAKPFQIAREH